MKPRFFILDEQHNVVPVDDVLTWARWFEVDSNRVLDFTSWQARPGMPARELSTIFVGLEPVSALLERGDGDPPLVFETMVFTRDVDGRRRSVESYRWATWDEATKEHRRIFERINADDMNRAESQLRALSLMDLPCAGFHFFTEPKTCSQEGCTSAAQYFVFLARQE